MRFNYPLACQLLLAYQIIGELNYSSLSNWAPPETPASTGASLVWGEFLLSLGSPLGGLCCPAHQRAGTTVTQLLEGLRLCLLLTGAVYSAVCLSVCLSLLYVCSVLHKGYGA